MAIPIVGILQSPKAHVVSLVDSGQATSKANVVLYCRRLVTRDGEHDGVSQGVQLRSRRLFMIIANTTSVEQALTSHLDYNSKDDVVLLRIVA